MQGEMTSPKKIELRYTYEMDGDFFVGYLDDYPEYPTQGENLKDFEDNLSDIYELVQNGTLDVQQKHGVLEIAG
jgi:predicted RNase H-like HicB family nuclease